jgi:PAS domain S-box-containing protein
MIAILGAGLVLALNAATEGTYRRLLVTIVFILAVLAAAALGGWRPGLLGTLLSVFGYYLLFSREPGTFWPSDRTVLPLLPYLVVGAIISLLCEALLRAWRRIAERQARLEEEIIERRRAEQQSQERAERLRVTFSSIGDAVITTDVACHVTSMNAVAESLTGWSEDEALHRPLTDVFQIIQERTRAVPENLCAKVLRTSRIVGLANHTVLISRDGREIPIDDSAAPIKDNSGIVLGVVLVFRDATRERAAQEAWQRLASIVEHSEDAIIGKTIDGVITSWNAAERLYGYSPQEAIGQSIEIIVPAEKRGELSWIMKCLSAGEPIDSLDTLRRRKDDSLIPVSLQISPIRDIHGDVVGASAIARDITARKWRENALAVLARTSDALASLTDRESALRLAVRAVVPFFADGCVAYTLDHEGMMRTTVVHHHDAKKEAVLEELVHRYQSEWIIPARKEHAVHPAESQYYSEMPDSLEASIGRDERHLQLLGNLGSRSLINVPLVIRNRTVGGLSFVISDSSRRYTDRDVAFAEDVARRVATALDNAELLESIRAADRRKDEFLAMLAHELRNPLAAIAYANELILPSDEEVRRELVDLVNRQLRNLSHLIDGLLDVSRITRDKIQLRKDHFDGVPLLRRVSEVLRPLAEEKRHEFIVDIQPESIPLFADVTRVEQILTNVLTNAIKYTPDGGRIGLIAFHRDGHAVIQVQDSGIGISREMLPRIFDLFAQAEQALDRSQGGLGIGLTIARRLTELHGGTLTATSTGIGQGAEFTIRLPLGESRAPEAGTKTEEVSKDRAKRRILVVDDNRDTVRTRSMFLSARGHEVARAYDGPAAVEAAERFRPQAIFLDLGLPGMTGYEVAGTLRAKGFTRELFIAISGYGRPEDQQRSREAGFDHHIVKPVDPHRLSELLESNGCVVGQQGEADLDTS